MQCAEAAMSELTDVIGRNLHPMVAKAAAKKRPAHIAFLSACLQWPDLSQAAGYVQGFPMIGELPSSGVFRQLLPIGERELGTSLSEGFFGQAAIAAIDALEARPPSQDAETIWRCVNETISKGSASPAQTRAYYDKMYGRGRWRPMTAILVTQSCEKERVINDGRAGVQEQLERAAGDEFHHQRQLPRSCSLRDIGGSPQGLDGSECRRTPGNPASSVDILVHTPVFVGRHSGRIQRSASQTRPCAWQYHRAVVSGEFAVDVGRSARTRVRLDKCRAYVLSFTHVGSCSIQACLVHSLGSFF